MQFVVVLRWGSCVRLSLSWVRRQRGSWPLKSKLLGVYCSMLMSRCWLLPLVLHLTPAASGVSKLVLLCWRELLSILPPLDSLFLIILSLVKLHLVLRSHLSRITFFLGLTSSQRMNGLLLLFSFLAIGCRFRLRVISAMGACLMMLRLVLAARSLVIAKLFKGY